MTPPTPPRDPVRCSATPGLLSEGPRWDADRRELQWVDFIGWRLHRARVTADGQLKEVASLTGVLYRLELDGTCTTVLRGLTISNGIGWSPDGGTALRCFSSQGSLLATVPLPVDGPTPCGGTGLDDGPAPVRTLARAASHTVQIPERGYVEVGHDLRSSLPHVFAAGDVNGISMLVPSARLEGRVAAQAIARQMGTAPSAPTWDELQAADTPSPRARPSELGP